MIIRITEMVNYKSFNAIPFNRLALPKRFFHLYNEYVPYIRSYKHIDYNDYTGKGHHFEFLEVDTLKIQYFYNLDTKNSQRQLDLAPGFLCNKCQYGFCMPIALISGDFPIRA